MKETLTEAAFAKAIAMTAATLHHKAMLNEPISPKGAAQIASAMAELLIGNGYGVDGCKRPSPKIPGSGV